MKVLFLIMILSSFAFLQREEDLYRGSGSVNFLSEAPLEIIRAQSEELKGFLDLEKRTFAFSIRIKSFDGFNSALQKEHFNEHYLESDLYPKATFSGNLIGAFNCDADCSKELIAKGKMNIHNETKIVAIPLTLSRKRGVIKAVSNFEVELVDYNISIPKILEAKISPTIKVAVEVNFEPHESN